MPVAHYLKVSNYWKIFSSYSYLPSYLVPQSTPQLLVTSSGPASVNLITAPLMGLYKRTDRVHNSRPIYLLSDTRTSVLFVNNENFWVVGPSLDSTGVLMFHPERSSAKPPTAGWLYDDGTGWRLDTFLAVSSFCSRLAAFNNIIKMSFYIPCILL